ncbi:cupin domain-containing protein [Bacillus salipaludis]|uniref:Cupin domain-containing protein n=1 Tax=Bacillus salipaludis TaxID=2547811 RepID=A0A4R5VKW1_9BACI|nr:cupin domain-containing protein [Bacillus salipaludis]MDQ6596283.1 cupin domain-containing protein [Bacillus salipaludis]TDK58400.1 cupin domain-containing protein [Bacillus salipaludis]
MEKNSVEAFMEYSEERFTKRVIYKKGETTAFVLNFLPGQELPVHKHPGTEVYLYVITGAGTLVIDGEETDVTKADLIHVSSDEEMSFENNGNETVSLHVVLSKFPSDQYAKNI